MLDGYNVIEQTDGTTTLHFFYDSNSEVIGFRYNGNDYFYVKNAMNDIIAITDSNKNIVAEYRYDPWGKVLDEESLTTIGDLNPFRYRSYYYDSDIKMYYLQSRYYDAEVGRFISSDDVTFIGFSGTETGYNPFVYCENDPVNNCDPMGNISLSYFPRTWITKFLLSLVGYEVTHRKEIHSIEALGIRIALTQVATYTVNPKAFFTASKSSISASLGGLSFSLSKLTLSATSNFSYKGVSVSSFVGVSKTYIEFGMLVSQYVQGRYKKCSFGIELAVRVKKTVIRAMAVIIVAANLLLPQLTPVFAKGAIVVSNLVTAAKINAKVLLTPVLYVVYKAFC